jgi:hypothetical protein
MIQRGVGRGRKADAKVAKAIQRKTPGLALHGHVGRCWASRAGSGISVGYKVHAAPSCHCFICLLLQTLSRRYLYMDLLAFVPAGSTDLPIVSPFLASGQIALHFYT